MPVDSIQQIADLTQRVEVADLRLKQIEQKFKGFGAIILDLAMHEPFTQQGWGLSKPTQGSELQSGYLYAGPNAFDAGAISDYLDKNLGKYNWWRTEEHYAQQEDAGELPTPQSPTFPEGVEQEFPFSGFKVLGARGANEAVDVLMFLQDGTNETRVSMVAIQRPDGTWATPGGMKEGAAKDKAFAEFLEEIYSADMFCEGSKTLEQAQKIEASTLQNYLAQILSETKFKELAPFAEVLSEQISNNLADIDNLLLQHATDVQEEDLHDLAMMLKCRLYAMCFAGEYQAFHDSVMNSAQKMHEFAVLGDPRNTGGKEGAYMVTTPYTLLLEAGKLKELEASSLLKPKGGYDTEATAIFYIEDLLNSDVYATQRALILKALHHLMTTQDLKISETQMSAITKAVEQREFKAILAKDMHDMLNSLKQEKSNKLELVSSTEEIEEGISALAAGLNALLAHGDTETQVETTRKVFYEVSNAYLLRNSENAAANADPIVSQPLQLTEPAPKTCWQSFMSCWNATSDKQENRTLLEREDNVHASSPRRGCMPW